MKLVKVRQHQSGPLTFACIRCGHRFQQNRKLIYADLEGKAFVDYYCEDCTVPFARRHLAAILLMAESQAADFGSESVVAMIAGFNCLKDYSAFEVEKVLMHPRADGDGSTAVLNALAWYALEETCRAYNDVLESA